MARSFEEKCRIYKQQQTVAGKRTQEALYQMVLKMEKKTGVSLNSGKLEPIINLYTGKITDFIER